MRPPPPGSGADRGRLPHAGGLFTDRESESQAYKTALATFRRRLDRDDEVGTARHNVLTFYGFGGIGKTALSERLEAWSRRKLPLINGWGPPPATRVDATVRIDLHGSAGQMDLLSVLLALRSGVASLRRRWPVFDLTFAAYWSAVRPGEPLPGFRGRDEFTDTVADTVTDLLGDLGSVADVVGAGTGAGLAVRGVRKVVGELRRRRDVQLGVDAFSGFEGFLMRCADEPGPTEPRPVLACEIAGALAWELACSDPCPLVTVFVDTTERLALDPRRVSEGHLNQLIHSMPNVLFVLTGRDLLDWYDETRAELPYRGPWTWPGLVPGTPEPGQHLVRKLSRSDSRAVILKGRRQLDLAMSDAVVDKLVVASDGSPQYLELARQVAISIKDAGGGRQVQVADVTGSLRSLVMRVLDDVPADEQRAIRAACLFRVFDTALVAAAARVDHGCAERAVQRPIIDRYDGERFPYRMHDAVREAIRRVDHQVAGGWSERDWQRAATRAAAAARRLHDVAKERADNREVLDALGIAVTLVCDQDTELEPSSSVNYRDWLTRAIVFNPSVPGLRARIPSTSRTDYGRDVLDFVVGKSTETPFDDRLRLLRGVFDSDHPLRLPAGRHLGYTLRLQRRWDEALTVFDEVVALAPTPLNRGQRPQVLSLARRFVEARDAAAGLPGRNLITRVADYAHGRPERYFTEIDEKIAKLRRAGRQREYLEDVGVLLERRVFLRGDVDPREIEELREEAELLDEELRKDRAESGEEAELTGHVSTRSALLATVLRQDADPTDLAVALGRLEELDRASTAAGTVGYRYALAELSAALLADEPDRLAALRGEVLRVGFRTRSWIPVECLLDSLGFPLPPVATQWLEPYDVVKARWAGHLNAYLARHRAAGRTPS